MIVLAFCCYEMKYLPFLDHNSSSMETTKKGKEMVRSCSINAFP
jgi:hypothetical protein